MLNNTKDNFNFIEANIIENELCFETRTILDKGIVVEFELNRIKFSRFSMIQSKELIWWKINGNTYLDEKQSQEMEGIFKNIVQGDKYREILSLTNC